MRSLRSYFRKRSPKARRISPSTTLWLQLKPRSDRVGTAARPGGSSVKETFVPKIYLAKLFVLRGDHKGGYAIARELESRRSERFVPLSSIAAIYSGLGNKDRALELLEKAAEERELRSFSFQDETLFDNLRSEPRFREILRQVNLDTRRAPSP